MKISLFLLALTLFFSCSKKDTIDVPAFWQCNKNQNLDSTAIANKLLGSWVWAKQSCWDDNKVRAADKNVIVNFNINGNFNKVENGTVITQGTWKLKIVDSNMYGLELTQPSQYLHGRILFCDNEVLFNDSYRDGCDNVFNKK